MYGHESKAASQCGVDQFEQSDGAMIEHLPAGRQAIKLSETLTADFKYKTVLPSYFWHIHISSTVHDQSMQRYPSYPNSTNRNGKIIISRERSGCRLVFGFCHRKPYAGHY